MSNRPDSQVNYDPLFLDDDYVDIWNPEKWRWEDGGIVYGSAVSEIDGITHNYFVILYDGICYVNGTLRHNGKAKWIEEKYLSLALNPKID